MGRIGGGAEERRKGSSGRRTGGEELGGQEGPTGCSAPQNAMSETGNDATAHTVAAGGVAGPGNGWKRTLTGQYRQTEHRAAGNQIQLLNGRHQRRRLLLWPPDEINLTERAGCCVRNGCYAESGRY